MMSNPPQSHPCSFCLGTGKWGYQPIENLPASIGRRMFVAISITPAYTTDPWAVWHQPENPTDENRFGFVRWPHPFPPTHFMILPEPRA